MCVHVQPAAATQAYLVQVSSWAMLSMHLCRGLGAVQHSADDLGTSMSGAGTSAADLPFEDACWDQDCLMAIAAAEQAC